MIYLFLLKFVLSADFLFLRPLWNLRETQFKQ